jgi:hypothetical protein
MVLTCNNLSIEVVRQAPNISSACGLEHCGGGTTFTQMQYKVYLRYVVQSSNPPNAYMVDYSRLSAEVKLNGATYSRINSEDTQDCFNTLAIANNWDPEMVIFNANKTTASIDFDNLPVPNTPLPPGCGNGGERIRLVRRNPTLNNFPLNDQTCNGGLGCNIYLAELFSVLVDAYPGESLSISCGTGSLFQPSNQNLLACTPIDCLNSGTNNGGISFTAVSPQSHVGTQNEGLQLALETPFANAADANATDIPIKIYNNGTKPVNVNYLEFRARLSLNQFLPVGVSGNAILVNDVPIAPNDHELHLLSQAPLTLGPGGASAVVCTLTVKAPVPSNLGYSGSIAFSDITNSRVKTTVNAQECSRLGMSSTTQNIIKAGQSYCSNQGIRFKMRMKDGVFAQNCSANPVMQLGLKSNNGGIMNVTNFSFEVKIKTTDALAIESVNFNNWATSTCVSQLSCSNLPNCYDISGDVVRFCVGFLGSSPLTITDEAYINVVLSNDPGCIEDIEVLSLSLTLSGTAPCIPTIDDEIMGVNTSMCPPQIKGRIAMENNAGLEAAQIELSACSPCASVFAATTNGSSDTDPACGQYGFCPDCIGCTSYKVTPEYNLDPLNGVSTLDLVLLSKHILGIEPLGSPYKMIAADANISGSITTFDIVEIRKLILGVYTQFPNNKSWRFVDKAFVFPNPLNPFQTAFPENKENINPQTNSDPINFVAVKVGDLNMSAISCRPEQLEETALNWPRRSCTKDKVLSVPLVYQGGDSLLAIQTGFRFDPAQLEYLGMSKGDLPAFTADNLGLARIGLGEIRVLWTPPLNRFGELYIAPGTVLCHLHFVAKADLPEQDNYLAFDNNILDNLGWGVREKAYTLTKSTVETPPLDRSVEPVDAGIGLSARCLPNPGDGHFWLEVASGTEQEARVMLTDATGKTLLFKQLTLSKGSQTLRFDEMPRLPRGAYSWQITTNLGRKVQGQLIVL